MSQLGLVDRVKSWFAAARRHRHRHLGAGAKRWPSATGAGLALASIGQDASPLIRSRQDRDPTGSAAPAADRVGIRQTDASPTGTAVAEPETLPQAEWLHVLEDLPDRIAESVATSPAGTKTLEKIHRELDGHRDTARTIAEAVKRLPDLATDQAALTRRTHELLARQVYLAEATVDGFIGLRAALKSVEESAGRHAACIAHLESCHRQVLEVYQAMLLKAHRRLGRLAALGVLVASAALGAVAYVLWMVLAAP